LGGETDSFFNAQAKVAYRLTVKGWTLDFSYAFYSTFKMTVRELLKKLAAPINFEEIQKLNDLIDQSFYVTSNANLRMREEQICEKVSQLKVLLDFTKKIVVIFDPTKIVDLFLSKITLLFKVKRSFFAQFSDGQIRWIYPDIKIGHGFRSILERTSRSKDILSMDEKGNIHTGFDKSQKRIVAMPVNLWDQTYGIFVLYNKKSVEITEGNMIFLYQFVYILAIALKNAFMMGELEQNRQELHCLNRNLLSLQEEERRELAASIHDSISQELTAMSFKIQMCKHLVRKDPELLCNHLNGLMERTHKTMDRCREFISGLRPDSIETIGLVPSLKAFFKNFEKESGIIVKARLAKDLPPSYGNDIYLFRIIQEALANVYKHSKAKVTNVILRKEGKGITLVVSDNGKGFDRSIFKLASKKKYRIGLRLMKERAEKLGGTFILNTAVGKGCQIIIRIPLTSRGGHEK
jgi:two-component system, NarL family, sensor histidine kinase DegS